MDSILVVAMTVAAGAWLPLRIVATTDFDLTESFVLSVGATLGIVAIAASVGHFTSAGLGLVLAGIVAGMLLTVVTAWRTVNWQLVSVDRRGLIGVATAGIAVLLSLSQGSGFLGTADNFYHAASMRTLALTRGALVTDPFYGTTSRLLDPTTGSWHSLGGALASFMGDPVGFWPGLIALGVALTVATLWLVIRRVTGSTVWAAIAVTIYVIASTQGVLVFRFLPASFGPPLVMFCMLILQTLIERPTKQRFISFVLLSVGAGSTHLGVAQLWIVGTACAWLAWFVLRWAKQERLADPPSGARVAGLGTLVAMMLMLPTTLQRITGLGGTIATGGSAGHPEAVVVRMLEFGSLGVLHPAEFGGLWLYLGAIAALWFIALSLRTSPGRRHGAVLAFALVPVSVAMNPVITPLLRSASPYALSRLAEFTLVSAWVAMVCAVWLGFAGIRRQCSPVLTVRNVALAVTSLAFLVASVRGMLPAVDMWASSSPGSVKYLREADLYQRWGKGTVARLQEVIGDGMPVVMGTPFTQYQAAGLTSARVIAVPETHTPFRFAVREYAVRDRDSWRFLDPATSEAERRVLARTYEIDYVMIEYPTHEVTIGPGAHEALVASTTSMLSQPDLFQEVLDVPGVLTVARVQWRQGR